MYRRVFEPQSARDHAGPNGDDHIHRLAEFLPKHYGEIFVRASLEEVEEADKDGKLRSFKTRDYKFVVPEDYSQIWLDNEALLDETEQDQLYVEARVQMPVSRTLVRELHRQSLPFISVLLPVAPSAH
jgi:hypothetical protein